MIEKIDYVTAGVQYNALKKAINVMGVDVSGLPGGASITIDRCGDIYLTVGGGPGVSVSTNSSSKIGYSGLVGSYQGEIPYDNVLAQKKMINFLEGAGTEEVTNIGPFGKGTLTSEGGVAKEYIIGSPSIGSSTIPGISILVYRNPNPTNNIWDGFEAAMKVTPHQIIEQHPELREAIDAVMAGIAECKERAPEILNFDFTRNSELYGYNRSSNEGRTASVAMATNGTEQSGAMYAASASVAQRNETNDQIGLRNFGLSKQAPLKQEDQARPDVASLIAEQMNLNEEINARVDALRVQPEQQRGLGRA